MTNATQGRGGWFPENDFIATRHDKAEGLRQRGINPYANDFRVANTVSEIFSRFGQKTHGDLEGEVIAVSVAGRVRFRRQMGKASFVKIQDWSVREGAKPPGMLADGSEVAATDDFLQLWVRADGVGAVLCAAEQ
jgi:lysyl-tRNA synthetase class II